MEHVKMRRQLKGHFGKVYALHWGGEVDKKSNLLLTASQDGKMLTWDTLVGDTVNSIPLRSSWVMTCCYEQSEMNLAATGGLDNICSIYKMDEPNATRASIELAHHKGYLSCVRFVDEGQIISCSGDRMCILWDIETKKPKWVSREHEADVMSVS
eukprot:g2266.t1